MPLFAEKLVIKAAGIPRLRSRPQTPSGLPSRTVDGWMRVRIAMAVAGRPATKTHAAASKAEDVAGRLGCSVWPMITPPRTGPTI